MFILVSTSCAMMGSTYRKQWGGANKTKPKNDIINHDKQIQQKIRSSYLSLFTSFLIHNLGVNILFPAVPKYITSDSVKRAN